MKKVISTCLLSIIIASSSVLFSSCNKSESIINIHFGDYVSKEIANITELPKLNYDNLSAKILNNDSFLLAIYGEESCGCWNDYQPVLTEYVNDTHIKIDYISSYDFIGKENTFGLYLVASELPSLAVFENGQLKIQSVYLRDDRMMFKSYTKFKEFIDKNVVLPKMLYVDQDFLDSMIQQDKEFNLYVARSACGDCSAVTHDVLLEWSKNVKKVNDYLYVFDIQKYYPQSTATEEEKAYYQLIKDTYGLSEKNNPAFGFGTGVVPTFQRRKGSKVLDSAIVLNDKVDKDNSKLISYFTSDRVGQMSFLKDAKIKTILDGMELTSEQVTNWRSYKSEFYSNYHYPIVRLFLETYVK